MRDWGVRDTPHAFKENKPFVVLLLAEANTQCEGVLKSFWPGAVSKEPGLTAVPQQEQAKLVFKGNTVQHQNGVVTQIARVAYICLMSLQGKSQLSEIT